MNDRSPHSSLKPSEAILQVSPTTGAAYRGNSLVLLAIVAIAGSFLTCGWWTQSQLSLMRSDNSERYAVLKSQLEELKLEVRLLRIESGLQKAQHNVQ